MDSCFKWPETLVTNAETESDIVNFARNCGIPGIAIKEKATNAYGGLLPGYVAIRCDNNKSKALFWALWEQR